MNLARNNKIEKKEEIKKENENEVNENDQKEEIQPKKRKQRYVFKPELLIKENGLELVLDKLKLIDFNKSDVFFKIIFID